VFFLGYLRSELLRRKSRTILTLAGLAIGVALVVAISAVSRGLDHAQKTALNPLSGIGTDLTVTRAAQTNNGGFGGGPFGGGPFGGGGDTRDLLAANSSVITDLSKLGKPGQHFVHDFFLPGTQLTFPVSQAKSIATMPHVAAVSEGLVLIAEHQEGTVPRIVATLKAGGQTFNIRRQITPPTAAEQQAIQKCIAKLQGSSGGNAAPAGPTGAGGFGRRGDRGQGGGFRTFGRGAFGKCLPARFHQFRTRFTSPVQTLRQVLDPPQTNIKTEPYTIAGVDTAKPTIALVTPSQVTKGHYFSRNPGRQALVAPSYATKNGLKVGSKFTLNGTTFVVVGIVQPPLGGQTADVYLPLAQLQKLAGEKGLANVALVRADSSSNVGSVQQEISSNLQGSQVASSKQVADKITGSLVDASNLANKLGLVLSIVAAATAFLIAALLTLTSVGKRVRELGTLKALGWTQGLVVRQVVGESLATGIVGGALGIALGIAAAASIDAFGPSLTASSTTGSSFFGLGAARTAVQHISLDAPLTIELILVGFLLALLGGLIAGAAGAMRAARLRPADALRQLE
jgi:ABC-type antimicrobial peptide transport system permease subunit